MPVKSMALELIFIHLHKTGGNSIKDMLTDMHGDDAVSMMNINQKGFRLKYMGRVKVLSKDRILRPDFNLTDQLPQRASILMGHIRFPEIRRWIDPQKYRVVSWLRDPVERVISHFYYRKYRYLTEPEKMKAKPPEFIEDFIARPNNRNRMHARLEGIALQELFFVGITEHLFEDFLTLCQLMGWTQKVKPLQRNSNTSFKKQFPPVPEEIREEIRRLNAIDVALYEEALALRQARRIQLGEI